MAPIPWQLLPLPAALTSTSITVKQREARVITEDIMLPVPELPRSVRPHTAALPAIQSQSRTPGVKPRTIYRGMLTMPRTDNLLQNWRINSTRIQAKTLTIRVNCLLGLWSNSSNLHASTDVAKFCSSILATHPCDHDIVQDPCGSRCNLI